MRFELTTSTLARLRSTPELRPHTPVLSRTGQTDNSRPSPECKPIASTRRIFGGADRAESPISRVQGTFCPVAVTLLPGAGPMNENNDGSAGDEPATPQDVFRRLTELGIETRTQSHPPLFTVEESKSLRGDMPGVHCKNLFLRDRRQRMWLVVCREDLKIDLKRLGNQLGADRLSFGSPDRLMRVLGVIPGGVSPFALINDKACQITVILDHQMLAGRPLNYHPISNEMTTAIEPDALIAFIRSCGHEPVALDLDQTD